MVSAMDKAQVSEPVPLVPPLPVTDPSPPEIRVN